MARSEDSTVPTKSPVLNVFDGPIIEGDKRAIQLSVHLPTTGQRAAPHLGNGRERLSERQPADRAGADRHRAVQSKWVAGKAKNDARRPAGGLW